MGLISGSPEMYLVTSLVRLFVELSDRISGGNPSRSAGVQRQAHADFIAWWSREEHDCFAAASSSVNWFDCEGSEKVYASIVLEHFKTSSISLVGASDLTFPNPVSLKKSPRLPFGPKFDDYRYVLRSVTEEG